MAYPWNKLNLLRLTASGVPHWWNMDFQFIPSQASPNFLPTVLETYWIILKLSSWTLLNFIFVTLETQVMMFDMNLKQMVFIGTIIPGTHLETLLLNRMGMSHSFEAFLVLDYFKIEFQRIKRNPRNQSFLEFYILKNLVYSVPKYFVLFQTPIINHVLRDELLSWWMFQVLRSDLNFQFTAKSCQ